MDVSDALLVAIMFVMILSIGISNILMGLAVLVDRRSDLKVDRLHTSWTVLLLLAYFNLFWHTIDLLSIEDWTFSSFLFVIGGPVLILFATNILLPDAAGEKLVDLRKHYFDVAGQFFVILALLMAWMIAVDVVLGGGLTVAGAFNAVAAALFLWLAFAKRKIFQVFGAVLGWTLFLVSAGLRGWGVIE
jgi:hypothetical protein